MVQTGKSVWTGKKKVQTTGYWYVDGKNVREKCRYEGDHRSDWNKFMDCWMNNNNNNNCRDQAMLVRNGEIRHLNMTGIWARRIYSTEFLLADRSTKSASWVLSAAGQSSRLERFRRDPQQPGAIECMKIGKCPLPTATLISLVESISGTDRFYHPQVRLGIYAYF